MKKPVPYLPDRSWISRVRVIRILFLFLFGLLLCRLFFWQILRADQLQALAESQYETIKKTTGSRGKIYSADGYLLATNIDVYTLFAEPHNFTKPLSEITAALSVRMPWDLSTQSATDPAERVRIQDEWRQTFLNRLSSLDSRWIALKRKLPKQNKEEIETLKLDGIGFERGEMRQYPESSMAAHILGFVGSNERGQEQGYFGIEGAYDRELRSKEGRIKLEKDALGLQLAIGDYDSIGSQDGRDVVLTIRRDLQYLLENKLKEGMEKYGSKTAEAVIMDPKTGAILAMASFPNYDPSSFHMFDSETYKNLIVQDVYEPGSTMKILTVSAGVDAGAIKPDTICTRCFGPRVISGYTIKTWNEKYFPDSTITDGLVHSDNTVMIFSEEEMGKDVYVDYLQRFGLGRKTGLDVQEEALPPFRKDWRELDAATASFGQGIAVTGIQMLNIAQAIANKGVMMRPMLVQAVRNRSEEIDIDPRETGRPITPETASTVTTMMEASALHGDAKWAIPKGYRIAGKTGTAQVPVAGHYDEEKTVASFIGFAPADDPKFVMLVKLREPQTSPWGSETAAPLWFSIARDLFLRMNIPPR
ncbi:MAG TPA: penicillin-binding protein 2 [Patescibacteria group bacterium]|nr:penicillin-binding protein 2 [Patescibacteria group bacterium]